MDTTRTLRGWLTRGTRPDVNRKEEARWRNRCEQRKQTPLHTSEGVWKEGGASASSPTDCPHKPSPRGALSLMKSHRIATLLKSVVRTFKMYYFILCECVFCLHRLPCTMFVQCPGMAQKTLLDPLQLELQVVVSHHWCWKPNPGSF